MKKPIEFEKFIQAVLQLDEFSVSIERMNRHLAPQNALAALGVDADAGPMTKPLVPFG
tara:strand:- start:283 stop:456 length:174 start_codon:yes stop_codon:yes gene_type:complete